MFKFQKSVCNGCHSVLDDDRGYKIHFEEIVIKNGVYIILTI